MKRVLVIDKRAYHRELRLLLGRNSNSIQPGLEYCMGSSVYIKLFTITHVSYVPTSLSRKHEDIHEGSYEFQ